MAAGYPTARAADPRTRQRAGDPANRVSVLLLGLAPGRVCRVSPRIPVARPADSSLWHWSSPHGGRALPATLALRSSDFPRAARCREARDHPIGSLAVRILVPACRSLAGWSVWGMPRLA